MDARALVDSRGNYLWEAGRVTNKFALPPDGKSSQPLDFVYGAGGGFSTLYTRHAYQRGVVPAGSPAGRVVPDVGVENRGWGYSPGLTFGGTAVGFIRATLRVNLRFEE